MIGLLAIGCGAKQSQEPEHAPPNMQLLAVLPIEPAADATSAAAEEAGVAVSAQIYRVLAEQVEFRVVPDLTVADVLETPEVRGAGSLVDRAEALGKEVGADGVIFGRVLRYRNRIGTEYGASEPASVAFELGLLAVSTGEIVWHGSFDQTQEPLTSNLLNWWMFWRAGPRWLSAGELAGLGIERLFDEMRSTVNTEG